MSDYAERRSEAAFAEIVRRHVDLVHSAALRMIRDPHLAQDVTQNVFLALADNAGRLAGHALLAGWLLRTTRNVAANVVRSDVRRRAREQEAAVMNEPDAAADQVPWDSVAPHLDAALAAMSGPDRDALLLRYFERKSARQIAEVLGTNEDAAQKRVRRALERLRDLFDRQGLTIGSASLASMIAANAVQAAPIGLGLKISAAAALAGGAAQTVTAAASATTIAMTTLQKTLIGATLAVAVGTGIHQAWDGARLRAQVRDLERRNAVEAEAFQLERDDLLARVESSRVETDRARSQVAELSRLRGEVARLRSHVPEPSDPPAPAAAGNAPPRPAPATEMPRESWADVGFATPEDALRTRGWIVVNGDRERFKESVYITDGARKTLEDMFVKMAEASKEPNKAQFLEQLIQNGFGVEEGLLMPMMAQNRNLGFTGYRILAFQSPSPEERVLQVETTLANAPAKVESIKFRQIDQAWKVVIDEDFVAAAAR